MSPRQPFSYLVVLSFVAFLACAAAPALGDVSIPTNTYVYFEQGGAPYNGSVQYTVTCYGYTAYPGSPSFSSHTAPENTSETVYSYSASCPGYGCVVYEPYYLNYRHIERCDLSGTGATTAFRSPVLRQPRCRRTAPCSTLTTSGWEQMNTTTQRRSMRPA